MKLDKRYLGLLLAVSAQAACDRPTDDVDRASTALQDTSLQPAAAALDPAANGDIVGVGHGVAVDSQGNAFKPTRAGALAWQKAIMARLEPSAGNKLKEALVDLRVANAKAALQRSGATATVKEQGAIDDNAKIVGLLLSESDVFNAAGLRQINLFLSHELGASLPAPLVAPQSAAPLRRE